MKTRQLILLLSVITFTSLGLNACKTKSKRSTPAAGPAIGGGDDQCSFQLLGVKPLLPASAASLKVNEISLAVPAVGNGEILKFTSPESAALPDLYIYRGYKNTGSYKYPQDSNGVKFAACSSGDCFAGSTFWGSHINSRIPAGTVQVTAWACVDAQGPRVTGAGYEHVAVEGRTYKCGKPLTKAVQNNHQGSSIVEDTLAYIDTEINTVCAKVYKKITSDEYLEAYKKAKNNTVVNSILGAKAMGVGAYCAKLSINGEELASVSAYAEQKTGSGGQGLWLTNDNDSCLPDVDEDDFDDYVSNNPPPTTDPVEVIPPVVPEPTEPTTTTQEEETPEEPAEETATTNPEDERKEACKVRGERLSELGNGSTEWEPGRNGAQGTCWVVSDQGQRINVIEPSIAGEPEEEEVVQEPAPSGRSGLSAAKKWGVAFMLIGAGFAAVPVVQKLRQGPAASGAGEAASTEARLRAEQTRLTLDEEISYAKSVQLDPNESADVKRLAAAMEREASARKSISEANDKLLAAPADAATFETKPFKRQIYNNSWYVRASNSSNLGEIRSTIQSLKNVDAETKSAMLTAVDDVEVIRANAQANTRLKSVSSSLTESVPEIGGTEVSRSAVKATVYDPTTIRTAVPDNTRNIKKVFADLGPAAKAAYANPKNKKIGIIGAAIAIFGTGLLTFGLTSSNTILDATAAEANTIASLNFCKNQLVTTGKLSNACQKLLK